MTPALEYVCNKISRLEGVESAFISDLGSIQVVIAGGMTSSTRDLREDILDIGKRAMLPVQVYYRLADGKIIGEQSGDTAKEEWVDDFYKPLIVPGFLGTTSEAPPEEVSKDPKGALKLRRVRASTRGKPVVAWRYGEDEVRSGSKIKFNKETALQWTMNRSLSVRPGAVGRISQLSSRRPIAFIQIGDYQDVELPIHMLGHFFSVIPNDMPKSEAIDEAKKSKDKRSEFSPEFNRILNTVGFDKPAGWGRDHDKDNVPVNQPFDRDGWMARSKDVVDDSIEFEEIVSLDEAKREAEEDMLVPFPRKNAKRVSSNNKRK